MAIRFAAIPDNSPRDGPCIGYLEHSFSSASEMEKAYALPDSSVTSFIMQVRPLTSVSLYVILTRRHPDKLETLIRINAAVRVVSALVGAPFGGARRRQIQLGDLVPVRVQNRIRSADRALTEPAMHSRRKITGVYLLMGVSFVTWL